VRLAPQRSSSLGTPSNILEASEGDEISHARSASSSSQHALLCILDGLWNADRRRRRHGSGEIVVRCATLGRLR
jgi:hypothetical protein